MKELKEMAPTCSDRHLIYGPFYVKRLGACKALSYCISREGPGRDALQQLLLCVPSLDEVTMPTDNIDGGNSESGSPGPGSEVVAE